MTRGEWPFFSIDEAEEFGFCECGHQLAEHADRGRCGWAREKSTCACVRYEFDEERSDPEFFLAFGVPQREWPDYVKRYFRLPGYRRPA